MQYARKRDPNMQLHIQLKIYNFFSYINLEASQLLQKSTT